MSRTGTLDGHGAPQGGGGTLTREGSRPPASRPASMRHTIQYLSALLLVAASARAGIPAREIVVQLSSPALAGQSFRSSALPAAVRRRFAALGLLPARAFAAERAGAGLAPGRDLPAIYDFHPERILLVEAADSSLANSALVALAGDPLVDWAEPNVTRSVALIGYSAPALPARVPAAAAGLDSLANDPYLRRGLQYGLWNLGPQFGTTRADVHAIEAWHRSVGANTIKLAVADTGIDPAQPELGGLMPDGSPRIVDPFNATDDTVGGVIDLYGHGTPVAGVMAARTNDGPHFAPDAGIAGVCGGDGGANAGCRIVPIKIAPGHSGDATTFDIARACVHAADVGARAMNLSFAGDAPSRVERLALTYALYNGCVPVCAAGNSGFDEPRLPLYPAVYARDGLAISVGASDENDRRTAFSS